MTFQEFLEKYNGHYIDFDLIYGPQCLDLEHQYIVEVLGLTDPRILASPAAKDVYNNFDNIVGHEYFERIPNTPEGVPQEGDIVFWGYNPYGHVAIFIEGDVNSFRSFDQNYPTGSPCHVQNHTYSNVLGWLRPKQVSCQAELEKVRLERDRNWNWFVAVCEALGVGANVEAAVNEAKKLVGNDDALVQKEKQLQEAQTKIADLETKVAELSKNNEVLHTAQATLEEKTAKQQKMIDDQAQEITDLSRALHDLKEATQLPVFSGWKKLIIDWLKKL